MRSTITYTALAVGLLAMQPAVADFVWGRTDEVQPGEDLDLTGTFTTTCHDDTNYDQTALNKCGFTESYRNEADPFLDWFNAWGGETLCEHEIPGCENLVLKGIDGLCGVDYSDKRPKSGEIKPWGTVVEKAGGKEVGNCSYAQRYESQVYRLEGGRKQWYSAEVVCETNACGGSYDRWTKDEYGYPIIGPDGQPEL